MKVIFYAQSRLATGCDDYLLKTDKPVTAPEFWAALVQAFPGLSAQQKSARLARRETYLQADEMIHPDDEIAVIPPVSGG